MQTVLARVRWTFYVARSSALTREMFRHQDLIGALALEIFERPVQLRRRAGGDNVRIVVEIGCRRRRNDFTRKQPEAEK